MLKLKTEKISSANARPIGTVLEIHNVELLERKARTAGTTTYMNKFRLWGFGLVHCPTDRSVALSIPFFIPFSVFLSSFHCMPCIICIVFSFVSGLRGEIRSAGL